MRVPDERRSLHIIALVKIAKGLLLLLIAFGLFFLDWRNEILQTIISWTNDELMLVHSRVVHWLLAKLDLFLEETHFRFTAFASFIYSALLLTEGVGVWMQKRWAEWLMLIGSASLIPFEVYHFVHTPSIFKCVVIIINVCIALYLWRTLHAHAHSKDKAIT